MLAKAARRDLEREFIATFLVANYLPGGSARVKSNLGGCKPLECCAEPFASPPVPYGSQAFTASRIVKVQSWSFAKMSSQSPPSSATCTESPLMVTDISITRLIIAATF